MPAREVVGTVEWPGGGGVPIAGARVTASVYAGVDGNLVYASSDVQLGQAGCLTDGTGSWSLTLTPNDSITPSGTVYKITVEPPDAAPSSYWVAVPDTAGPHEATDILAEEPGAVPSQALAAHAALTTAHGATGSIVGTTNSQTLTNKTLTSPVFTFGAAAALAARTALGAQRADAIDVREYGAVGDGATDDTTAIQSALDAATSRPLHFPAGTYLVSSTLTVPTIRRLSGDGRGLTFLKASPSLSGPLLAFGPGDTRITHGGVTDIGFVLTGSTATFGLAVDYVALSRFENLAFTGGNGGISVANSASVVFSDITMRSLLGDWVRVNGDGGLEHFWERLDIYVDNVAISTTDSVFEVTRTTTVDTGGIYLDSCKVITANGVVGSAYRFDGTAGLVVMPVFANQLVSDSIQGAYGGIVLRNLSVARIAECWFHTSANYSITIDGCSDVGISNVWAASPSGAVRFLNSPARVAVDQLRAVTGPALYFPASGGPSELQLGAIHATTLANDMALLADAATAAAYRIGTRFLTKPTGNGFQTLGVSAVQSGVVTTWHLRQDSSGNFQILNTSFTEAARFTPSGTFVLTGQIQLGAVTGPTWSAGTGSPLGVVAAVVGSLYSRTDGGASTSLYVKESGTGTSGWVAK